MSVQKTIKFYWCPAYDRLPPTTTLPAVREADFFFISRGKKGVACIKDLWGLFPGDAGLQGFVDFEDAEEVVRYVIEKHLRACAADNEYRQALEANELIYSFTLVDR